MISVVGVEVWRVLAVGACLVSAGAAGAAAAAWPLLVVADVALGRTGGREAEVFAAELGVRARMRIRAVGAALAAAVLLAVAALVTGIAEVIT